MFSVCFLNRRAASLRRVPAVAALTMLSVAAASGQSIAVDEVAVSPDITIDFFGAPLADHGASTPGSPGSRLDFGPLPDGVEVTGFHISGSKILFAVDQPILVAGTLITPWDVATTDGATIDLFFKGSSVGLGPGAGIDAVAVAGERLVVSLDTARNLNGLFVFDEDLVAVTEGPLEIVFDGSLEGVPPGLDLDAAHFVSDSVLGLSFDGGAKLGGLHIDDEDVVAWNGAFFARLYDGSTASPGWAGADLNGVHIEDVPDPGLIFEDGFESGNTGAWTVTVP